MVGIWPLNRKINSCCIDQFLGSQNWIFHEFWDKFVFHCIIAYKMYNFSSNEYTIILTYTYTTI